VRYLIISDIHANREALETAICHAQGKYDEILCCGDVVGYGADPNFATEWTRANARAIVRGNHDKACAGLEDLEWFNPAARKSAEWTHDILGDENLAYLRELPQGPTEFDGFGLMHGSPLDEDEYVIGARDAAEVSPYLETRISFFGHTHLQGGFLLHRNGVQRLRKPPLDSPKETLELEPDSYYLINAGSIGQPRDGDPRAAYLVYTPERQLVEFYRVPYDVGQAQEKIRQAGLPDVLADRLAMGL
jgi:predicted phosphodiesterase